MKTLQSMMNAASSKEQFVAETFCLCTLIVWPTWRAEDKLNRNVYHSTLTRLNTFGRINVSSDTNIFSSVGMKY